MKICTSLFPHKTVRLFPILCPSTVLGLIYCYNYYEGYGFMMDNISVRLRKLIHSDILWLWTHIGSWFYICYWLVNPCSVIILPSCTTLKQQISSQDLKHVRRNSRNNTKFIMEKYLLGLYLLLDLTICGMNTPVPFPDFHKLNIHVGTDSVTSDQL